MFYFRAPAYHQCPNCAFEDNSKAKLNRHFLGCTKRFKIEKNLEPPMDWDTPAKLPKLPKNRMVAGGNLASFAAMSQNHRTAGGAAYIPTPQKYPQGTKILLPPLMQAPNKGKPIPGLIRTNAKPFQSPMAAAQLQRGESDDNDCLFYQPDFNIRTVDFCGCL